MDPNSPSLEAATNDFPSEHDDSWDSPSPWEIHCRRYLDLLLEASPRWRNVVIETAHRCDPSEGRFSPVCPHSIWKAIRRAGTATMPLLHNLAVYEADYSCRGEDEDADVPGDREWRAPMLESLEIAKGLGAVSLPRIRELVSSSDISPRGALQIFKACAGTLNILHWRGAIHPFPIPVCLDRVRTLILNETWRRVGSMVLTPALETMVVRTLDT